MANNVHQLRPKPADSEKITINLGFVDLGHIDLMVQEGFYSNPKTRPRRPSARSKGLFCHPAAAEKGNSASTTIVCSVSGAPEIC
jgi:hypothetical protein